jgi:hypothetical protein
MQRLAGIAIALALGACGAEPINGASGAGGAGGTPTGSHPIDPPDLGPCPIPAATNPLDPDAVTAHPDNDPGCPATPGVGSCASAATLCAYDVPCQSGLTVITFACSYGKPSIDPERHERHPCSQLYDYCESIDSLCVSGGDPPSLVPATGADDPHACPWDRPAEGSKCTTNYFGGPECGYWCDDSHLVWTVTECVGNGSVQPGYWIYDDACRSECLDE